MFYALRNSIKIRKLFYFTATNPGIWSGGMGIESKFETLQLIPEQYKPESILIKKNSGQEYILNAVKNSSLSYPIICKPDIGFRGLLVKKINSEEELLAYLKKFPINFILQEFIPYEEELGVFYHRLPGGNGQVSSITTKEFLHVIGDAKSTVFDLVKNKPRAYLQLERLQENMPEKMLEVPAKDEYVPLGNIGNHAMGTIFKDGNHLINPAIEHKFDEVAKQIDGFYYGRFDVRCKCLDDLETGKHLKIIEINGICAEPTHMYDPYLKTSFLKAFRIMGKYHNIAYQISKRNIENGAKCFSVSQVWKESRKLKRYKKQIQQLEKTK